MIRPILVIGVLALIEAQAPASSPLRIVVIEGEGAVNIIQQKTAVRPLVEIRDRNNLPVAGATVTFTIGGGSPAAFAGGVQTLTVTTNAAGQAAAGGLNALSSGAFQIQVQAAYQGQIATAAISQTNFATAAAASQASASGAGGGTGGSTGGTASGAAGGGGISGTTIGIVGAAIAGGAVTATQVSGGDKDVEGGDEGRGSNFTGSFSGQVVVTTTTSSAILSTTCVSTRSINGTFKIALTNSSTGMAETAGTQQEVSFSGAAVCVASPDQSVPFNHTGPVRAAGGNLTFTSSTSFTAATPTGNGSTTSTETVTFTGSLSGGTITGTLGYEHQTRGTIVLNGVSSTIVGNGSTSIAMTLR